MHKSSYCATGNSLKSSMRMLLLDAVTPVLGELISKGVEIGDAGIEKGVSFQ